MRPLWLLLGAMLAMSGPAFAADAPSGPPPRSQSGGGGVLTRYFQEIGNLESQVEQSLSKKDAASLSKLLSPIFIQQQPGRPLLTHDEFIGTGSPLGQVKVLQVHETGGVLVAVLTSDAYRDALITDVWQATDGTHWQLRLRIIPGTKR
jgi:hypothetical protein